MAQDVRKEAFKPWVIVAGKELADALDAERDRIVKPSKKIEGCYDSESLSAWQVELSRRGILIASIERSIYGYGVRYASGLQDFAILASARSKDVDGSYEDALRWATKWQQEDPTRRYVEIYRDTYDYATRKAA